MTTTTKHQVQFTELELRALEDALYIAARKYEDDEHDASCKPGHVIAESNARDCKKLALKLADRLGDLT